MTGFDKRHGEITNIAALTAELAAPVISKRRWAAWDLSCYPEAVPVLLAALVVESEQVVRDAILEALRQIGGVDTVAGLIPLLRSTDASLRHGVIAVLEYLSESVSHHIIGVLHEGGAEQRILAIELIQTLLLPQAEAWLLVMLKDERRPAVVLAALDCLGSVGSSACLPALSSLGRYFAGQDDISQAVRAAMCRIGISDPASS